MPVPLIAGGFVRVAEGEVTVGAAGAEVSTVTACVAALLALPAASVAVTENEYVPSASVPVLVIAQAPVASAVVVCVPPLHVAVTVAPTSAVPLIEISESFVMPSELLLPLSTEMPVTTGSAGEVASIVTTSGALGLLMLPAESVAVTVSDR